jgi:hypothetical protein
MNIIPRLTSDCPRKDCSLSGGIYTTTCMGWCPTYDKNGNLIGRGDPNISTSTWVCVTCGASWRVKEQYGEYEVTRADPQKPEKCLSVLFGGERCVGRCLDPKDCSGSPSQKPDMETK